MLKDILLDEPPFSQLSSFNYESNFVIIKGKLFVWGKNQHGQLGLGDRCDRDKPQLVTALLDKKLVGIKVFQNSVFLRTAEGELYVCGENTKGELGLGHSGDCWTPQLVETLVRLKLQIVDLYGMNYTGNFIALCKERDNFGSVCVWGNNENGDLGLGDTYARRRPTHLPMRRECLQVLHYHQCNFLLCVSENGKNTSLFVFGNHNLPFRIGVNPGQRIKIPTLIPEFENMTIEKIYPINTARTAMAVRIKAGCYVWRDDAHHSFIYVPKIHYLCEQGFRTFYINAKHRLSFSGYGARQVGLINNEHVRVDEDNFVYGPAKVDLPRIKIASIYPLSLATMVVATDGTVYMSGKTIIDNTFIKFSKFTDITELLGRVIDVLPPDYIKTSTAEGEKIYYVNTKFRGGLMSDINPTLLTFLKEHWQCPMQEIKLGQRCHQAQYAKLCTDVTITNTQQSFWEKGRRKRSATEAELIFPENKRVRS